MIKITYIIESNYWNANNYATCSYGYPESVFGEDCNDAVEKLIQRLRDTRELDGIISSRVEHDGEYRSLKIFSIDDIQESYDPGVFEHDSFKKLVDEQREKITKEVAYKKARILEAQKNKELQDLARLKAKYEK